jgi:hypothetical protein
MNRQQLATDSSVSATTSGPSFRRVAAGQTKGPLQAQCTYCAFHIELVTTNVDSVSQERTASVQHQNICRLSANGSSASICFGLTCRIRCVCVLHPSLCHPAVLCCLPLLWVSPLHTVLGCRLVDVLRWANFVV